LDSNVRYFLCLLSSLLLGNYLGCAKSSEPTPSATISSAKPAAQPESIGQAWLDDNGTLMVQLRAEGPGGAIGDVLYKYLPNDKEYEETLRHIGGLKKGEKKPVPPWPDDKPRK